MWLQTGTRNPALYLPESLTGHMTPPPQSCPEQILTVLFPFQTLVVLKGLVILRLTRVRLWLCVLFAPGGDHGQEYSSPLGLPLIVPVLCLVTEGRRHPKMAPLPQRSPRHLQVVAGQVIEAQLHWRSLGDRAITSLSRAFGPSHHGCLRFTGALTFLSLIRNKWSPCHKHME